jgi:hypothetical protein
MLHFIYTGELDNSCFFTRKNYYDLLRIAHMYNLAKLVKVCVLHLAKYLDEQNIFDTLELAEQFGAEHLKDAAITFIAGNLKTLINKAKFSEIIKPSADLLFAILQKSVK